MDHPFPREVRQVLAELELVSHGKTQSFNSSGKGKAGSDRPFGDPFPEFVMFRAEFEACNGNWPEVLERAREALKALKGYERPKHKGESVGDLERRIIEGEQNVVVEGCAPQEVADWARVTVQFVMKVRRRNGRDPMTGRPIAGLSLEDLLALGLGARQIARHTGLPLMTVQYRLQKRRAA